MLSEEQEKGGGGEKETLLEVTDGKGRVIGKDKQGGEVG